MRPALTRHLTNEAGYPPPTRRFTPTRRRVLFAWLLVVSWAWVIWQLGGDDYSFGQTSRFLQPLIDWLLANADATTRLQIHAFVRKSAHFVEYAILALLAFRAAILTAERHRIGTACWVALFFVATVAAADEIRQGFSAVRTGSPYDVLIDLAGGIVGLIGVLVIMRRARGGRLLGTST